MMIRRIRDCTALLVLVVAVTGCGPTAPARFYTLEAVAAPSAAPTARYGVLVGPVTIPPALDRPQIVVQAAPNRIEIEEYDRWAAPLADGIAAAVAANLSMLLGTSDVVAGSTASFGALYRVSLAVQRFVSLPGKEAEVDVVWTVRKTGGDARSGRSAVHEPVATPDFDALAAAHSRALAKVSSDIAAAIETDEPRRVGERRGR